MKLKPGMVLHSTDVLNDTFFEGAIIFIAQCDVDGAVGFIINQPFGRSLQELEAYRQAPPFALYKGGPVDQEHLFILHRNPQAIKDGVLIGGDMYLGGDFSGVTQGLHQGTVSTANLKIFIGYCGWNAGELEAEIAEGSWIISEVAVDAIFRECY